jgi:PAS domain S-box-containing protein
VRLTGTPRVWQGPLPHAAGHDIDVLGHVFPLPAGGDRIGVGEVFLDVSDQVRSRRALAESEQRYRAIFDSADVSIVLLDGDASITDANPAAVDFTGRALHDLRGRDLGGLLAEPDRKRHQDLWHELMTNRRTRYDLSVTLRRPGHRPVPARLTTTLLRDPDGNASGGLAFLRSLPRRDHTTPAEARTMLTAPEAAVLQRLAAGSTLQQIATELKLSRRGVDYRVAKLRHKLRFDGTSTMPATIAALIARAYAIGLLQRGTWPPRVSGIEDENTPDS